MFTAATAMVEGENTLLAEAEKIGQDVGTDSTTEKTAEPTEGSYERFMASFGSPRRWAGSGG